MMSNQEIRTSAPTDVVDETPSGEGLLIGRMLALHSRLREVATDEIWEVMLIGYLRDRDKPTMIGGEVRPVLVAYRLRNESTREMVDVKADEIGEGKRFRVEE